MSRKVYRAKDFDSCRGNSYGIFTIFIDIRTKSSMGDFFSLETGANEYRAYMTEWYTNAIYEFWKN